MTRISACQRENQSLYNGDDATAIQPSSAKVELGMIPLYNLSGQRVDSDYKGIVIRNGRKYIKR